MVLADGGVVCIDEFDKMREEVRREANELNNLAGDYLRLCELCEFVGCAHALLQDRVAIHEAMEQQTISIAKAGITTILNSRTSVLAAANPLFGRYDDMKTAADQIDFQTTILSRFDLIFVIKDARVEAKDKRMAKHIMNLHMGVDTAEQVGDIDVSVLKRYIEYANVISLQHPIVTLCTCTAAFACLLVSQSTPASPSATNSCPFAKITAKKSATAA